MNTNFWPGKIAPDFLLNLEGAAPATFYERYCGRTTVVLLARDGMSLVPFVDFGSQTQLLAVISGSGVEASLEGVPAVWDDGRIARAFLGRDRFEETVAVILRPTLAVAAQLVSPTKDSIEACLAALPVEVEQVCTASAPVLMVPDSLPTELCSKLISAHDADNFESGMLRQRADEVALVPDPEIKKRRDHLLAEEDLVRDVTSALSERLLPAIARAFHYPVTRMESYKVVAYDAEKGGYFKLHRDNMTPDARHRRFALSLNLNEDYEGGELVFPEFGACLYRPPAAGALVFSGSHLHGAREVTAGTRYVLLTFLWGDEVSSA
ncbi:MAG: 2OG-Fe(II) oxygenase [Sedimenticolaceae bacterium]